jgi:ATP-dependent Lon protease
MDEIETKPAQSRIELPPLPADAVPIVATRNLVLFPGIVLPVALGREESIAAAQEAVRTGRKIGLLLQRDPSVEKPTATDLYEYGVLATVVRYVTSPGGAYRVAHGY